MEETKESVVWESRNGTWTHGIFAASHTTSSVLNYEKFLAVSSPCGTKEEAERFFEGLESEEPTGEIIVVPYKGNSAQSQHFDHMALEWRDPVAALAHRQFVRGKDARRGHVVVRCMARTLDGTPCQNPVIVKGRKCRLHRYQ